MVSLVTTTIIIININNYLCKAFHVLLRKGSAHGTVVLAVPPGKGNQDPDLAPALLRWAESFSATFAVLDG